MCIKALGTNSSFHRKSRWLWYLKYRSHFQVKIIPTLGSKQRRQWHRRRTRTTAFLKFATRAVAIIIFAKLPVLQNDREMPKERAKMQKSQKVEKAYFGGPWRVTSNFGKDFVANGKLFLELHHFSTSTRFLDRQFCFGSIALLRKIVNRQKAKYQSADNNTFADLHERKHTCSLFPLVPIRNLSEVGCVRWTCVCGRIDISHTDGLFFHFLKIFSAIVWINYTIY